MQRCQGSKRLGTASLEWKRLHHRVLLPGLLSLPFLLCLHPKVHHQRVFNVVLTFSHTSTKRHGRVGQY